MQLFSWVADNNLGRWIHLDGEDRHVIVMWYECCFLLHCLAHNGCSCFSLEVVSEGVMYYTALMPHDRIFDRIRFAAGMGVTPEAFSRSKYSCTFSETGLKMGVVALGCAVISVVFCII